MGQPLAYARGAAPTSRVLIEKDNNTMKSWNRSNLPRLAPNGAGNVQVHWPEGNALIKRGVRDPKCGIPDYNAAVEIDRAS